MLDIYVKNSLRKKINRYEILRNILKMILIVRIFNSFKTNDFFYFKLLTLIKNILIFT